MKGWTLGPTGKLVEVQLLPWQEKAVEALLSKNTVVINGGCGAGRTTVIVTTAEIERRRAARL